ncbi:MAG: dienelactone hydrolase [Rhizobiales bacterium 65-9]|nr:MAG: dienelactone hydrolase [Rhizobiales bacterium 65-9]
MAIHTISYKADGLAMVGKLHIDETRQGRRPGVLVFPEAFGFSAHADDRAARLASLGYAALACDLHGEGRFIEAMDVALPLVRALRQEPARIRARAKGALDALVAQPLVDPGRIAAIGFCFGGSMALELARSGADIRGAVGFHSGLSTLDPADAKNIKGKVLVCIGADDLSVPPEQRAAFEAEMRGGGVDWRMHLYGGVVHSFTDPDADARNMPERLRYDAGADARSWAEMRAFFNEIFA